MEKKLSMALLNFSKNLNKFLKLDTSPVYGEIKNPFEHVNHHYDGGWSFVSENILEQFEPQDMHIYSASDHCTLASLTAIFSYYKRLGFDRFPIKDKDIFKEIFEIATSNGYYEKKVGTYPWRMAKIANTFVGRYGYKGKSDNQFVFFGEKHTVDTLKNEINSGRPGLINFAHGSYRDHSVTYYGYQEFIKDGEKKLYLLVNNNWDTKKVYVDISKIGNLNTPFSITKIILQ